MPKVPRDADPKKVIRALERLGFRVAGISVSHYKLVHEENPSLVVVVPFHGKLKTGTLSSILKASKVKVEEFLEMFALF